jgi:hypothetical protein
MCKAFDDKQALLALVVYQKTAMVPNGSVNECQSKYEAIRVFRRSILRVNVRVRFQSLAKPVVEADQYGS